MGNFDRCAAPTHSPRIPRSVLQGSVGPKARNAPRDLHIIIRTLTSAGLLDEGADPACTHNAIFKAIRHVRRTLNPEEPQKPDATISPADEIEQAVRRALAQGRFPLSHRIGVNGGGRTGARAILDSGKKRALARVAVAPRPADTSPHRRALLPVVNPETFLANRRLSDALASGGEIPGLDILIAETFATGGKQAFSDVRDFIGVLRQRAPVNAAALARRVETHLSGRALRLFRKLLHGRPPSEGDFQPPSEREVS
ncbi:MAG: hypothetical protein ACFE0S_00805 [Rhodospirillales bacterium]